MALTTSLSIVQVIICLYVLIRSTLTMNAMSRATQHAIRSAHVLVSSAAFLGVLVAVWWSNPLFVMAMLGVALYLYGEKRNVTKS